MEKPSPDEFSALFEHSSCREGRARLLSAGPHEAVARPTARRPRQPRCDSSSRGVAVTRGPPNGTVTTPCSESPGIRSHRT
eukprot:6711384-Pyramimonas_sp.AAC.1